MEGLVGVAFKDFVLVASDRTMIYSIIAVKHDEEKIYKLSEHLVMAVAGESGDTVQFAEFIGKNIQLYKMRNGFELSPSAAAHFIQRNLADYLRSRTPYQVNVLLAGYDVRTDTPELYYLDHLATMTKIPYAMHGYGGFFATSILDRYYKADVSVEEGVAILQKCVAEVQKRLIVSLPAFKVVMVNKDAIHELPDMRISPEIIGLPSATATSVPSISA